jgi:CrcB protein
VLVAPALRFLIPVGFIGAYTTFSTFELETFRALEDGAWLIGATYAAVSIFFGFIAIWVGMTVARQLF